MAVQNTNNAASGCPSPFTSQVKLMVTVLNTRSISQRCAIEVRQLDSCRIRDRNVRQNVNRGITVTRRSVEFYRDAANSQPRFLRRLADHEGLFKHPPCLATSAILAFPDELALESSVLSNGEESTTPGNASEKCNRTIMAITDDQVHWLNREARHPVLFVLVRDRLRSRRRYQSIQSAYRAWQPLSPEVVRPMFPSTPQGDSRRLEDDCHR